MFTKTRKHKSKLTILCGNYKGAANKMIVYSSIIGAVGRKKSSVLIYMYIYNVEKSSYLNKKVHIILTAKTGHTKCTA